MDMPLDDLLRVRARNILRKMRVTTLGQLTEVSAAELLENKCLGMTTLNEIRGVLAAFGLSLKGDPDPLGPGSGGACPYVVTEQMRAFNRDPRGRLGAMLFVLDLCPRTKDWLTGRQIWSVADLVGCTEDELWLLALADDLPLPDVLAFLDEIRVRLRAFGLELRPDRPPVATFRPPDLGPRRLSAHRIDEFPLRAQTVYRLRQAGIRTVGQLAIHAPEVRASSTFWPAEPRAQVEALLDALGVPDCDDEITTRKPSESVVPRTRPQPSLATTG
jgi:hypothetical protein